jgi:hypothetical protein
MGFLFLILPLLAVALATADTPITAAMMIGAMCLVALPYLLACGLTMILIVNIVRNGRGWWNSATPAWWALSDVPPDSNKSTASPATSALTQSQLNPSQLIQHNRDEDQNAVDAVDVEEGGVELGLGGFLTAILKSERKGWWSPAIGVWHAARGKDRRKFEASLGGTIKLPNSTSNDTTPPSLIEQARTEEGAVIHLDEAHPIKAKVSCEE